MTKQRGGAYHVVVVGGGFGGLSAVRALRRAPVRVTLLDRRNFHVFQPLLYQVATGGLSPANIASPLRARLRRQRNVEVLMADVVGFDLERRRVLLREGGEVAYDALVVAAGARHHYFGHADWEQLAPGLKTIEDALEIRRRVLRAFEEAEREPDADRSRAWLTFVIVGAGPTGVELAGALAELAHHTLRGNFRRIDPTAARIFLVEGTDRILPTYPSKLSQRARAALTRLGVTVRTEAFITDVRAGAVTVRAGDHGEEIRAETVLWAAGVDASPLGGILGRATGAEADRAGRVAVRPDLSLPGHPEVFVIGDLALCRGADGKPVPGVAPAAIQQGTYVAHLLVHRLRGEQVRPFRYKDRGSLAIIGRSAAVADLRVARFNGWLAWLAWLFLHLVELIEFENRVLVLVQWAWDYFTRNRAARLITGPWEGAPGKASGGPATPG